MRPSRARVAALALALLAPALAGCSKQLPEVEYAEDVDFTQYRTYRWITEDPVLIRPGAGNPEVRSVANERRIRAAIERELEARGLREAAGEAADLLVAFSLGTKIRYQVQGGSTPLEMVADDPASVTQGVLTVVLFDRARNRQIWSAATKRRLAPGDDPDRVIAAVVASLLAEYPPGA